MNWIPYNQGDKVKEKQYLVTVHGEVYVMDYTDGEWTDFNDTEWIPSAYMELPMPYNGEDSIYFVEET